MCDIIQQLSPVFKVLLEALIILLSLILVNCRQSPSSTRQTGAVAQATCCVSPLMGSLKTHKQTLTKSFKTLGKKYRARQCYNSIYFDNPFITRAETKFSSPPVEVLQGGPRIQKYGAHLSSIYSANSLNGTHILIDIFKGASFRAMSG